MTRLEILLPFGLPPTELAGDLFKELSAPALATLVSRTRADKETRRQENTEAFSRSLPHEIWLSRRFGLAADAAGSPPLAPLLMRDHGHQPAQGNWFILQPVHIHIARDHLVLTDPRRLALDDQEAQALFDIAAPLFAEAGMELVSGDRATWFLRADNWGELRTATPDAASGHNIDIWMPKGPHERDWRKIQNEVQMHWFDHPVNRQREGKGLNPVNSVWLWGGAAAADTPPGQAFSHAFNLSGWPRAFRQCAAVSEQASTAGELLSAQPAHALALLDAALAPALANDWAQWLDCMRGFERDWFAPLLEAVKSGALDRLTLVLTDDARTATYNVTRASLRKFWVRPSLSMLLP